MVTEGLARWQLATGETLLEGAAHKLGPMVVWLFLPYLLLWSFFVASAQMSANGVALHAMLPVFDDPRNGKIVFGRAVGPRGARARAARRLSRVRRSRCKFASA